MNVYRWQTSFSRFRAIFQDIPLSVDLSPYIKLPTVSLDEKNGTIVSFGVELKDNRTIQAALGVDDEKKRLLDQNSYLEERIRQLT